MRKTVLAIALALSGSSVACSSDPREIAGMATITELTDKGLDIRTSVLDTGNDGKDSVLNDDKWSVDCQGSEPLSMVLYDKPKAESPAYNSGLYYVNIGGHTDNKTPADEINVSVYVNQWFYYGNCTVTFTETQADLYEADVSVSTCVLHARDGLSPARIESAHFHVKGCYLKE